MAVVRIAGSFSHFFLNFLNSDLSIGLVLSEGLIGTVVKDLDHLVPRMALLTERKLIDLKIVAHFL